ncbi:reverse transcriptase [Phytophthora megakarya]|uniref:Reverse transcriptase n=1 Tax=Phytophthora megakarya TaxID=4795 RepID=A0A225WP96_9STRA|nr:reverse transcriptase [Phytophthora megakarya]
MASGFWVVKMTDRAHLISAYITPFGLFEWNRISFGLKNAPQIYKRMIDNALYGFTRIPKLAGDLERLDVSEAGEPEDLLEACDKWNLSISVVNSFWGMPNVEYLGHKVSHDGLEANPKDLSALTDLGEIDYAAMEKGMNRSRIQLALASESPDPDMSTKDPTCPQRGSGSAGSFKVLKEKIAKTPILRHFDPDRQAVVVVYARDWAISGALMQEYDQIYYPVMFASRTLKSNELNYGIAEKEVLVLLRILDLNYNTLVAWDTLRSPWIFEIVKCNKGEDEILGTLIASITPRSEVDKALISIAPKKEPRRKLQAPIPTVRSYEDMYVASFDGSARVKRGGGTYSAILWKLPEWTVVKARSGYVEGLTVNEAE